MTITIDTVEDAEGRPIQNGGSTTTGSLRIRGKVTPTEQMIVLKSGENELFKTGADRNLRWWAPVDGLAKGKHELIAYVGNGPDQSEPFVVYSV